MQDLIIRNGRVIDWATHTDTVTDIAISGSRISKVGHCEDKANIEISADGLWVVPGIIDSHMHASSWLGGEKSMRMLAMAGVTTALEMAGPIESVKTFMKNAGTGLTIGCLEQIRPGYNVSSQSPSNEELERVIETSLENGAFGVKLLGGHYPLTPEATARLIRLCSDMKVYLAVHAGSTENGSNILGMREVIELADGIPFHLAHINAYCRGSIFGLDQEIREASAMLLEHPEIDCESYLSPINGCSGTCRNGIPESGVTRNCLRSKGYAETEVGLSDAISAGFARVHKTENGVVVLADRSEGLKLWKDASTNIPVSFTVNPALSRFYFATEKRPSGHFLVDSFCTDGGGIPRNVIIENGLSLVRFGAVTPEEFVLKSSFAAAELLGLPGKGRLQCGADADITVIDPIAQKAVHAFVAGRQVLDAGVPTGGGGTLMTTSKGTKSAEEAGLHACTSDIDLLFEHRLTRFRTK